MREDLTSMGTGKDYLVKDDDWIIIISRFFFPLGEGYTTSWAKLKNIETEITTRLRAWSLPGITTIELLECGFAAVHAIVATWLSVKPVVLSSLLVWRTKYKMYDY